MTDSMSTKNIIIFGQTGAGKSSVVNLIAGKEMAGTANEIGRCTNCWAKYSIAFDPTHSYNVFDTVGLDEHQLGMDRHVDPIESAHDLITKLRDEGGVHLLLFCVRAGRPTVTTHNNYRLFYETFFAKKVPIVLVITGLEGERNMDDWWTRAKPKFDGFSVIVNDHACITAVSGHQQYKESRRLVCGLVIKHCMVEGYKGGDGYKRRKGWLRKIVYGLRECFRAASSWRGRHR